MKKITRPGYIALSFAFLVSVIGCSKDALQAPSQSNLSSISENNQGKKIEGINSLSSDDAQDEQLFGSLMLTVLPIESKSAVVVYNDNYNSGEIYGYDDEGVVKIRRLETGTYNIQITPHNPGYSPVLIENVVITVGELTDLGIIELVP